MDLQEFSFRIQHRSGKKHIDADSVSRLLRTTDKIFVHTSDSLRTDNFFSEEDHYDLTRSGSQPQNVAEIVDVMDAHAGRDSHHVDDSAGPRTTASTIIPPPPTEEMLKQMALWKPKYSQIFKDYDFVDAMLIIGIMEEQEVASTTTTVEETMINEAYLQEICNQPAILSPVVISMNTSIIEHTSPLQMLISQSWALLPGTNNYDNTTQRVERFIRNPVLFIAYCEFLINETVGHASHALRHSLHLDDIVIGTSHLLCQMYHKSASFSGDWQTNIVEKLNNIGVMQRFLAVLRQVTKLAMYPPHYERAVLTCLGDHLWLTLTFQRENNLLTSHNANELLKIFPLLSWRTKTTLTPMIPVVSSSFQITNIQAFKSALKDITRGYAINNAPNCVLALATELDRAVVSSNSNFLHQLHHEQATRKVRQHGTEYKRPTLKTVLETEAFVKLNCNHTMVESPIVRVHAGSNTKTNTTVTRTYEMRTRPEKVQAATPTTATNFIDDQRVEKRARKAAMKKRLVTHPSAKAIMAVEKATSDERLEAIIEDDNHPR